MAGVYKFHSKLHRSSHHTVSGDSNYIDQGLDPIASQDRPFIGLFYNTLTDNEGSFSINTNSFEWWSAYNTVKSISGNWSPTLSLYTTVNSLSDNWNDGKIGYNTFSSVSANYESVLTTVSTYSADWSQPNIMFTYLAQESTRAKTFSGTNLTITTAPCSVDWDLDLNQVTFIALTGDIFVNNPTNLRTGGTYVLSLSQNSVGQNEATFDTKYRFNNTNLLNGVIDQTPGATTVITFVCVGSLMLGDAVKYPALPPYNTGYHLASLAP